MYYPCDSETGVPKRDVVVLITSDDSASRALTRDRASVIMIPGCRRAMPNA